MANEAGSQKYDENGNPIEPNDGQGGSGGDGDDSGGDSGGERQFPESVVKKLREENANRRKQQRDLEKQIEDLQAKVAQVDVDEYFQLKEKKEELDQQKMIDKGEFEKLRAKMQQDYEKELETQKSEVEKLSQSNKELEQELHNTMVSNSIQAAASAEKCHSPQLVELAVMREAEVRVDEETGKRQIVVLDSDGEPRLHHKTGKQMTIAERVQEMKDDPQYAPLFEGGRYGGGSQGGYNSRVQGNPFDKTSPHYNLTKAGQLLREQPEVAKRLAKEAGFDLSAYQTYNT